MMSDVLLSEEGTSHRDPLTMPFYALATILHYGVEQAWYADDACACEKSSIVRRKLFQVSVKITCEGCWCYWW